MTYNEARDRTAIKEIELNRLISSKADVSKIIYARGRYIASLQSQIKVAENEGLQTYALKNILNKALKEHKELLKQASLNNKKSNYSLIKDLSYGVKRLVNSVKMSKHANTDAQKKEAKLDVISNIGLNLKNVVKTPLVITSKILKCPLIGMVFFAPVSIGMGILHAAWTCIDNKPSPYDNKSVSNLSKGFTSAMNKLNCSIQKM